jgi:4-diphosphocytidyl-2-C-methyl-D-erythritol kinase
MTITVKAPAKINLTLEVIARRDDGYHELRSVIQTIGLYDEITVGSSKEDTFIADNPEWNAGKSLVSKTVALFRETTGCPGGVFVRVDKRIPVSAGLGGDSSDAAAVLRGLDRSCQTRLSGESLHAMAEKLGSDVPFFLYGGTALIEGRGEKVTPLPSILQTWFVLAVPPVETMSGKTGYLFSRLTPNHFTDGKITRNFVKGLETGGDLPPFFNTFENVAFECFPGLDAARRHFMKLGAREVRLAGSGPVLFTAVKDRAAAEELSGLLEKQNMRPFVAKAVSGRDYL